MQTQSSKRLTLEGALDNASRMPEYTRVKGILHERWKINNIRARSARRRRDQEHLVEYDIRLAAYTQVLHGKNPRHWVLTHHTKRKKRRPRNGNWRKNKN